MKSRLFILLSVGICGIAWAAAPDAATAPLSPIVAGEVAGKTAGPRASKFAPLSYFNQNCARCHGEYGAFYDEDLGKDKSEEQLREVIEEMANGPGQAPLASAELEIVTAWHRSLRDKKPFVVLVKAEKTEAGFQLSGEISPGATLEINGEKVEIDGSEWTAPVPMGELKLRATKSGVTAELNANAASFSGD